MTEPTDPVEKLIEFTKDDAAAGEVVDGLRKYMDYMIDKGLLPDEIRGDG